MSANDYISILRIRNPKLFQSPDARLHMKSITFEQQLRLAFEAGQKSGAESVRKEKSMFENIFGKHGL